MKSEAHFDYLFSVVFFSLLDFSIYFIGKIIYCCCISFIWLKMLICLFVWMGLLVVWNRLHSIATVSRSFNVFRCGLDFSHAGRFNQQLLSQSVSQLVRQTNGRTKLIDAQFTISQSKLNNFLFLAVVVFLF